MFELLLKSSRKHMLLNKTNRATNVDLSHRPYLSKLIVVFHYFWYQYFYMPCHVVIWPIEHLYSTTGLVCACPSIMANVMSPRHQNDLLAKELYNIGHGRCINVGAFWLHFKICYVLAVPDNVHSQPVIWTGGQVVKFNQMSRLLIAHHLLIQQMN